LHILFALAHERLICFGARRDKKPTFVLLDEWVPPSAPKVREEALAELAKRYLTSHGPATIADFAWWSGLTMKEANEALSLAGVIDYEEAAKGTAHLLPPFDEYTVAYKDRSAVLDPAYAKRVNAGGGMLNAIAVVAGKVVGGWKRVVRGGSVDVSVTPFRELNARETRALDKEATHYARFLARRRPAAVPHGNRDGSETLPAQPAGRRRAGQCRTARALGGGAGSLLITRHTPGMVSYPSTNVNVSSNSYCASSTVGISTNFTVSPGANVTVLELAL
jgi:hypothetical protein